MFATARFDVKEEIYASPTTVVLRAQHRADGRPAVIKMPRSPRPDLDDVGRLSREYELLRSLEIPEVPKALALDVADGSAALIMEDAGEPIRCFPHTEARHTADFLRLAIAITRAVQALHDKGVIHKDIKPEHFLRGQNGAVKVVDLGVSTKLDHEYCQWLDLDAVEGTLAYIPPEQTGRLHRPIDRRSDLYSLGVTFFEMVTGQLPFGSTDPLELVHCHIAMPAPRADTVCPALPPMVASIIEKLMAKDAEDRYQSAAGLAADLERCLVAWEATGEIERFRLGGRDLSEVLTIPQRLYGRDETLALLHDLANRSGSAGPRLVLISGPSGIGKSVLIRQLQKRLPLRGRLVSGKFDSLNRSRPYSALAAACSELVRMVLSARTEAFAIKKRALRDALGGNARIIIDIVPELELVLGPQPPAPAVGPVESQNRFERTFEAFLDALVTPDEPLVLFLDDLHWADPASLRLLHQILAGHRPTRPIMVIGSYRDKEVHALHPLMIELADLRKSNAEICEITLDPLNPAHVTSFVADALSRPLAEVASLAGVLFAKTRGNPFELGQYLGALYRDGLLYPDRAKYRWVWNLDRIQEREATDDLGAIVTARVRSLPADARRVLALGACIGHELDLATMALISGLSQGELVHGIEVAVREDVLVPLDRFRERRGSEASPNPRYRFAHDRLRDAAYALVAPAERAEVHLRIGEHLRKALGPDPSDERLFAVAQQMNLGSERIKDPDLRRWLAELNLRCGRKAQASAAFSQALGLFEHALALAGEKGWSECYAIVCQAKLATAECEYLRGDNDRALRLLDEIDRHATELLDKVAARNLRTMVLIRLVRPLDCCANSVAALRLLGADFPDPSDLPSIGARIQTEFAALQPELAAMSPDTLPEMSDPLRIAELQTLAHVIPAAFQAVPPLAILFVVKGMRLVLRHGASDLLPFFFAQYAIAHQAIAGDRAAAYRFGKLGLELGLRRKNTSTLGSTYFLFGALIAHWCEPIGEALDLFDVGLQHCLESGDLLHALYCSTMALTHRVIAGRPLAEVRASIPAARKLAERAGDRVNQLQQRLTDRLVVALAGEGQVAGRLDGDGFEEDAFIATAPVAFHGWLRWSQTLVRFQVGKYDEALVAATTADVIPSLPCVPDLALYAGLAHAALARQKAEGDRPPHVTGLRERVATFAEWLKLCPANFGHRHALLAAELADLEGHALLATEEYDKAVEGAQAGGFLQDQAIACELAGQFHARGGRKKFARLYLRDALAAYEAWGATAKVRQLQEQYPELEASADSSEPRPTRRSASPSYLGARAASNNARGVGLDMESAMRASHAIASELAAEKLLDQLMRILVENAGAQRGVLIVPKNEDLYLEAERTVSPDHVRVGIGKAIDHAELPEKLIRYVARTHETVVWGSGPSFGDDSYLLARPPRSALCVPLLHQGRLGAVLYLENRAISQSFNPARVSRIEFLAAQAAAALQNSRLYEEIQAAKRDLEHRVLERTAELRQRNTDLRNVLDAVNQGLVTLDRSARLTGEWSARAEMWFDELEKGRSWIDVLASVDVAFARKFEVFFAELVRGTQGLASLREMMPRKLVSGPRILEIDLSPVGGEDGWKRMLVVVSDVTDRERQARLEMDLRQAQKLQAVGELAAGIAHEINTPAQFVGDSVEFLAGVCDQTLALLGKYRHAIQSIGNPTLVDEMKRAEDEADMAYTEQNAPEALSRARDGVSRIATIVRAMKEFAHPDTCEKAPTDLNRALETTLTIARNEYKYVADVETAFDDLPLVYCHAGDLNQVFLNLIVNGAHAISDVVGKSGGKGRITVSTFNQDDTVRIEIADTGCGIPAEIRDRIFDPFFTTKEVGRGSGQGLAIARSIVVDKHGGKLTFESEVGRGTTFTVVLPVAAPTAGT